jgi:putative ABC transport system permease protein
VRRVPLARRNLFQDRRRAGLAVAGVGVALLLVLVLDGIFSGTMQRVTAYIDRSPATVFVSQQGVTTMHMSSTALPVDTIERAAAVEGADWAEGLWYTTSLVGAGDEQRLTYVFGYDTSTGRAGPQEITAGRAPGAGETIVDDVAADELGVGLGDTVELFGRQWRISGLATMGTSIVNTTVYVSDSDFRQVHGEAASYVLVGAQAGVDDETLARRVRDELSGTTVQTRSQMAAEEEAIVRDMSTDVMAIMTTVSMLIALAVIGLTLFAATLAKLREFGVLKAIGATPSRLASVVLAQATWTVALGLALAVLLSLGIGAVITASSPNVTITVELSSIARVGIAAFVIGLVAAIIPVLRVTRVDPASSFRSP